MTEEQKFVLPADIRADLEAICRRASEQQGQRAAEYPEEVLKKLLQSLRARVYKHEDAWMPLLHAIQFADLGDLPPKRPKRKRAQRTS